MLNIINFVAESKDSLAVFKEEPMKKTLTKLITICTILCMLTGCGDKSELPFRDQQADPCLTSSSEKTMMTQYSENYYPFPGGYTVGDISRIGNKLLVSGTGAEGNALGIADYTVENSGRVSISSAQFIALDAPNEANEAVIYDIAAGGDGYFYVLTGNERESYSGDFAILRYSQEGVFQDKMTIEGFFDETEGGLSIAVGIEGEIVLMGIDYVYFLLWQGTPTNKQTIERASFTCASSTKKGIVLSIYNFTLDASPFYLIDPKTGDMSNLNITNPVNPAEDVDGFKLVWGGSLSLCQGLNGEYISNSGNSFVLFDFDNDSYQELLRWNYTSANISSACRLTENTFICVSPDNDAMLLTGMEEVPYTEKRVVQVAVVGLNSDSLISKMNNRSLDYEYQTINYGQEETARFLTDLVAGKAFDLVLFNDSINTCSDYFDDLYPYIDADPDLSRDSFLPNLLESTSVHGQLHQLWNQTAISSLAGKYSYIGNGEGFTTADYLRIVKDNEQILAVFDTFMSKDDLLAYIARIGISTFVDKENASCSFDSQSFSDLLLWCKDMGNGTPEGSDGISYEPYEYILNPVYLTAPIADTYVESWGDYVSYVGFPNGATGYHCYSSFPGYGLSMAIPANSQSKDGAWAFIKEQLSLDAQLNLGEISALPVNYEALMRLAEASSTEAGCNALYDLLNKTKYAEIFADKELQGIIVSNSQNYISGDKSLEETIGLIQSKASIYVAEQYG